VDPTCALCRRLHVEQPTYSATETGSCPFPCGREIASAPAILKDAHHDLDNVRMANVSPPPIKAKPGIAAAVSRSPKSEFDEHMIVERKDGRPGGCSRERRRASAKVFPLTKA